MSFCGGSRKEGARGSQRELTFVVEKQRFEDLGVAIDALQRAEMPPGQSDGSQQWKKVG